jgi:tetratricopeptide (TPR) repeat protein
MSKYKELIKRAYHHLSQNDLTDAETVAEKALRVHKAPATAHAIIAECKILQGKLDMAVESLQHALKLTPNHSRAAILLGIILTRENNHQNAIKYLCQGLTNYPTNLNAFLCLNYCYYQLNMYDEMLASSEVFICAGGSIRDGYEQMALSFLKLKKRRSAKWAMEQALNIRNSNFRFFPFQLPVRLKLSILSIRSCLKRWSPYNQLQKNLLDGIGNIPSTIETDKDKKLNLKLSKPQMTLPIFRDTVPVFICGHPKSGTTLLLALLDFHQNLAVFPEETTFFRYFIKNKRNNPWLLQSLHRFIELTKCRHLMGKHVVDGGGERDYRGIPPDAFLHTCLVHWSRICSAGMFNCISLLEIVIAAYANVIGVRNPKAWVEKTPLNERFLDIIVRCWPSAKAIYILRNPFDNYASYRKKREREKLTLSIEQFYDLWSRSITNWEHFTSKHPDQALFLRYEDLVIKPEIEMKKVAKFLGIDWNQSLLDITRCGHHWSGNSQHIVHFSTISNKIIGIHRNILTKKEYDALDSACKKFLDQYYSDRSDLGIHHNSKKI